MTEYVTKSEFRWVIGGALSVVVIMVSAAIAFQTAAIRSESKLEVMVEANTVNGREVRSELKSINEKMAKIALILAREFDDGVSLDDLR